MKRVVIDTVDDVCRYARENTLPLLTQLTNDYTESIGDKFYWTDKELAFYLIQAHMKLVTIGDLIGPK